MKRARWLTLLHTGLHVREARFVRLAALRWLAAFPGDLEVQRLHAQALLAEGHLQGALNAAAALLHHDPEDERAAQVWARAAERLASPQAASAWATLSALTGRDTPAYPTPAWSRAVFQARRALAAGDPQQAETALHPALSEAVTFPLVGVTHVQVLLAQHPRPHDPQPALRHLAAFYHERFPETLVFLLVHADALMYAGQEERAVALLHQAAALDTTGQVARRLWGTSHPYTPLWPQAESLILPFEQPIPAAVAAALGWNRLPAGETVSHPPDGQGASPKTASPRTRTAGRRTSDAEWHRIQQAWKRLALEMKQPELAQADARFPVYVVLSTRAGLSRAFGQRAQDILTAMQSLVNAVGLRRDWDAALLLADDPASTGAFDLSPAAPDDPWAIKLLLADLDAKLAERGLMIGALLIVGGDEVVPFHRLPNPIDDRDTDIPSDNPYATRDENYFVNEWPLGRLPGTRPDRLVARLRDFARYHRQQQAFLPWHRRLLAWLRAWWLARRAAHRPGFGYAAAIWSRSAARVLRPIGDPKDLWTSPPVQANGRAVTLPDFPLAYFNLHGEADRAEWFGQADPLRDPAGVDYPIALRPADLLPGNVPSVVFSEACYGAHIFGKDERQSVALRFLACGTRAYIGSTATAYGSQEPPLFAADLLGYDFWKLIADGETAGAALQKARLHLAHLTHRQQGYLDGEAQKTLISFVLFGDPLYQPIRNQRQAKHIVRPLRTPPPVKTVCARTDGAAEPAPPEMVAQVRQMVSRYLPGMEGAHLRLGREHADCHGEGHRCPTAQLGERARPVVEARHRVAMLSKTVPASNGVHHHYARLTFDEQGRLLRIAVSR